MCVKQFVTEVTWKNAQRAQPPKINGKTIASLWLEILKAEILAKNLTGKAQKAKKKLIGDDHGAVMESD